jgi:hypothetical protein
MAGNSVEFSELATAGLKRLSLRRGLEFPENQVTNTLRYVLLRDPTALPFEPCDAWPERSFFVTKLYAGTDIRVLVERTDDRYIVWSLDSPHG